MYFTTSNTMTARILVIFGVNVIHTIVQGSRRTEVESWLVAVPTHDHMARRSGFTAWERYFWTTPGGYDPTLTENVGALVVSAADLLRDVDCVVVCQHVADVRDWADPRPCSAYLPSTIALGDLPATHRLKHRVLFVIERNPGAFARGGTIHIVLIIQELAGIDIVCA
jgi:hypothetical protein